MSTTIECPIMNDFILHEEDNKELIIKFFQGELSFREEAALLNWINQNKDNEAIFMDYRTIWVENSLKTSNKNIFNSENAWEKLEKVMGPHQSRSINWYSISKIASVIVFIFLLGAASVFFFRPDREETSQQLCEIVTPLGAKSMITLPDGTVVWLNAGSRLTYRKNFNEKTRIVSLEGEAFFKVKTNKEKPFVVNALGLNVKALGTTFNVKAYPKDQSIVATLVEGVIKVEGKGIDHKPFIYTLKPNQNIVYLKDAKVLGTDMTKVKKSSDNNFTHEDVDPGSSKFIEKEISLNDHIHTEVLTSWKDLHWFIEGEELKDLAVMLERRYNVKVHFKSEELKVFKFSGIIENETIEQVMEILKLTTPLKFDIGKGEVWWDIDSRQTEKYSKILTKKE
jgi:transmembrane sensor